MTKKRNTNRALRLAVAAMIGLVVTSPAVQAQELLAVDINGGASPTETGFVGQNTSGITHTTTAGNITVSFTGQQGTFDRGASGGVNNDLYRDFIFENNTGSSPDITLTLSGPGIAASTDYSLTFYAYDSGDSSRRTGISGISGTTGPTLGPVISQGTGVPDTLDEYAVTGTFTSDGTGTLTFGIDGLPGGGERTVLNGVRISAVSANPLLVSTDPADNEPDVVISSDLAATFSEAVDTGTGSITLKRSSDDATIETFAVTSSQLDFSGAVVTIDPTADLVPGVGYYVNIDATAIEAADDSAPFAGIADSTTWNFTADGTAPTLAGSDIVDDQSGGPVAQNLLITYTITFSEDIDASTFTASDLGDQGGDVSFTVGTINETSPGVFTVEVTPTSPGTLQLQVNQNAVIEDLSGNDLDTSSAIVDDTSITINPPDTTAPTLASADIVDDQSGGPIQQGTLVTYTVTFSEDIDDGTVSAADFGNAGTSTISIGTISETSPGVFSVQVTPSDAGTLQLEVVMGATIEDLSGNDLVTTSAIADDTAITVEAPFPGSITVDSYVYGANSQSQPQSTSFQSGRLTDLVNFGGEDLEKLTDGQLATGGWNDFEHVGFIDSGDSGTPQPRVTFDLGGTWAVSSIEIYSNTDFAAIDSVEVSVSTDGSTFTSTTSYGLTFSGGFANAKLTLATLDVSALPDATHVRLDFFQDSQWAMINEIVFYPETGGGPPPSAFNTWAGSNGVPDDSEATDSDSGGKNNLYEFGLGGNPTNGNDDGALLHAFSDDVVGGDGIEEGILTILVRNDAAGTFSTADPSVSAAADGIVYTVAGDTTPDVTGGGLTVTPTAAVTTGLPAAPAGYTYVSFYISGAEGYFQVTVAPE